MPADFRQGTVGLHNDRRAWQSRARRIGAGGTQFAGKGHFLVAGQDVRGMAATAGSASKGGGGGPDMPFMPGVPVLPSAGRKFMDRGGKISTDGTSRNLG